MHKRLFTAASTDVSEIGLGCWQLGGSDWGALDDQSALDILQASQEAGVDFFDTADVYGGGRSEELIGRFLRGNPGRVFVATKLGRTSELFAEGYTEAKVRTATEASLRRLATDELHLTQLHCVPMAVLQEGHIFDWLRSMKREGKIQNFGASVESMEEVQVCLQQEGLASLQIIFNIFRQKPIATLFEEARQKGVAIIVRLPLASGLLTGKMTKNTEFGAKDHRNYNRDGAAFNVGETFAGLPYELGVELADALKAQVPPAQTMALWALRWILDFEAVTTVIPGASRVEQAKDNASASDLPPLSTEAHQWLTDFYETKVREHIRGPY